MHDSDFKEVLSTTNVGWEREAESLASNGIAFVLVGFSYAHHVDFYNRLAVTFKLESRFDPAKNRAYFWRIRTESQ